MINSHAPLWQILAFGGALVLIAVLRIHGEKLKRVLRAEAFDNEYMPVRP